MSGTGQTPSSPSAKPNGAVLPATPGRKGRNKKRIAAAIAASDEAHPTSEMPRGFERHTEGPAPGIWRAPGGEKKPFPVCGPLDVIAESRPERQNDWGLLLRWCDRDGREHEWIMPRRLLAGDGAEIRAKLASCGLDMGAHPEARRALLEFLTAVHVAARVRTVARTGWYRPASGGTAFVLPGRTIGMAGGEIVRLDIDPPPTIYQERGTLAGWQAQVAARCGGNSRLTFAVSCGFTGPLLALADDEGGGINFRGASSQGKTTLVDAAASVWGAPSKTGPDSFTRTWRHTDNALETTAASHTHALLPLDELGQADPNALSNILYMLANGAGKGRARAGGGNRTEVTWLTLVLSSSEESAARIVESAHRRIKAGVELRLLDVPASVPGAYGAFEDLHGEPDGAAFVSALRRAMVAEHGTAGPAFVTWLAEQLKADPDFIGAKVWPRLTGWCRAEVPPGADGQVQRAARRFAMVGVAGDLATEAGVTDWSEGDATEAAARVFRDWLTERGGAGGREDQYLAAALHKFIGMHGGARFDVVRDPKDGEQSETTEPPEGPRTINRAGWRWREDVPAGENGPAERRWIYGIIPEVFDTEISGPLGMEARDARARLGRAGLIRGKREGGELRWTFKPRRLPGGERPRMVVVEPHILETDTAD